MAIVGAIAAVSGTAYSVSQQRKSNKAQRAASRAAQRQQELKAARSRRVAFRELQRRRATAQATAAALGASGSSGAAGGLASLTSQYGANLGYGSAMTGLSKEIKEIIQPGSAIIFPSFFMHKVNPVIKGERTMVSLWLEGPKFQ